MNFKFDLRSFVNKDLEILNKCGGELEKGLSNFYELELWKNEIDCANRFVGCFETFEDAEKYIRKNNPPKEECLEIFLSFHYWERPFKFENLMKVLNIKILWIKHEDFIPSMVVTNREIKSLPKGLNRVMFLNSLHSKEENVESMITLLDRFIEDFHAIKKLYVFEDKKNDFCVKVKKETRTRIF